MTLPNQVYQYPHETWSQAFHRRQAENLAVMEAAVTKLAALNDRDAKIGQELVQAFDDLAKSIIATVEVQIA
jgi:hypothetical protein